MKTTAVFFFAIVFHASTSVNCQNLNLDVSGAGIGANGVVRFNDPSLMGESKGVRLDYLDIRGNCFLYEDWEPAVIKLLNKSSVKFSRLKINLYTGQVHYFGSNNVEMVSGLKLVDAIFFVNSQDSTKISKSIKKMIFENYEYLFQVLTTGKYELLKRTTVTLFKGEYDVSKARNDYRFIRKNDYFLFFDGRLKKIEELNRENLASLLPIDENSDKWLKQNKNKLKNEDQLLAFLSYINLQIGK